MTSAAAVVSEKCSAHAQQIYAQLLVQCTDISPNGVKLRVDAANLATLSLKLALAFQTAENNLNAESLPKNQDFKVDVADIAGWSK